MKVTISYEDNDKKNLHKTLKITLPKSWVNGPTSKLLNQFVESYNASPLGHENTLLKEEMYLSLSNNGGPPLPSDGIVIKVISDRENIYILHGKSQTSAEIIAVERKAKEDKQLLMKSLVQCTHFGCNKRFKKGGPYPECSYHKAPPVFHETAKFWSCCPDKKAYDWDEFQAISGCQSGVCSEKENKNEKTFLGGCDVREAANGGEELKTVEGFNKAKEAIKKLRVVLNDIGVETEFFDQVINEIKKNESESKIVKILSAKIKSALKEFVTKEK